MAVQTYPAFYTDDEPPRFSETFTSIGDTDLRLRSGKPRSGCARIRVYNSGATEQDLVYYAYGDNPDRTLSTTDTKSFASGAVEYFDLDIIGLEATGTGADIQVTAYWWESNIPKND